MRICVLGAGGLGSLLGGYLAEGGVDVTLIGREPHMKAIREHGLQISGIKGDHVVRGLGAVSSPSDAQGEFDYLILLTKARGTAEALAQAASLRDRTAVALSLQNTVCKNGELAAWIGTDRVIGASTIEGGTMVAPGVIRHTATAPTTAYFGEVAGGTSARVDALTEAFNAAGFPSASVDDIGHVEWEKLLQIAVAAGWSASTFGALGGTVAEGLVVRESAEQYVALAAELLSVYRAMGYVPADFYAPFSKFKDLDRWSFEEAVDQMMALGRAMVAQGLLGRPSLHDDLLNGRPTEVDYSLGTWLKEADARGVAVPTARSVYRIVKGLEYWMVALGGATPVTLPKPATASQEVASS